MKIEQMLSILIIFAVLVPLSGCTHLNEDTSTATAVTTQLVIETLAAPGMRGRLVGSAENKRAEQTLSNMFDILGLKPLIKDSYEWPYTQTVPDPDTAKPQLTLRFKDNTSRDLIFGEEFSLDPGKPAINLKLEIAHEIHGLGTLTGFQLKAAGAEATAPELDVDYFITPVDNLHIKNSADFDSTSERYFLFIHQNVYDSIDWTALSAMEVSFRYSGEIKTVNNIVGYIPGKNHTKAFIVSSHFDGAGYAGKAFSTAAVDNASGVAAMLRTASVLISSGKQPEADVIICSFNGEETGQAGSQAFANEISTYYNKLVDMNIDCVGSPISTMLDIGCGKAAGIGKAFCEAFLGYLTRSDISCREFDFSGSDHDSFNLAGIPAVCILQEDVLSVIHTINDTPEQLDYTMIDSVGDNIAGFILSSAGELYLHVDTPAISDAPLDLRQPDLHQPTSDEITEFAETIRKRENLAFNEAYCEMLGKYYVCVYHDDYVPHTTFNNFYPDIIINDNVGSYTLRGINACMSYKMKGGLSYGISDLGFPLNEKFTIDMSDPYSIELLYESENGLMLIMEINKTIYNDPKSDPEHYALLDDTSIANYDLYYLYRFGNDYQALIYCGDDVYVLAHIFDPNGYIYFPGENYILNKQEIVELINVLDVGGDFDYYRQIICPTH